MQSQHCSDIQGHIQDYYNRVSISKKLQEYIGISSDQLVTIKNVIGLYL